MPIPNDDIHVSHLRNIGRTTPGNYAAMKFNLLYLLFVYKK